MCGVFGITGHPEASKITYLGLHALQHRGQESAGIVSALDRGESARFRSHLGVGLVADVFPPEKIGGVNECFRVVNNSSHPFVWPDNWIYFHLSSYCNTCIFKI